jgi:two-component system sensor histidine kinase BaeS
VTALRRLTLTTRLAAAMVAIAFAAVTTSMLLVSHGIDGRLRMLDRTNLRRAAAHAATLAARVYAAHRRFDGAARSDLREMMSSTGYTVEISAPKSGSDEAVARGGGGAAGTAAVIVRGAVVGRVVVRRGRGGVSGSYDRDLHVELNHVRELSALIAVVLAVLAAALTAKTVSRPLRRLTHGADRLKRGELSTEISGGGGIEIERLASALRSLAATLRREEKLRRMAAADIAHELRTPVTGILSRIEAMQDGVLDPAANLEALHAETLRLARLIEDVGHLAEAEQPGLLMRKTLVDLSQVARARAAGYASFFRNSEVRFVTSLESALVFGDAGRLEQVIDNLLANALRYTNEGGTVTLRLRPQGTTAVLEVSDTGIGIPPEDLPHVFERFWRADKSRSRATGGAGIGLAVVRELVQAHEGHIQVASTVGKGTTFRVTLPLGEAQAQARSRRRGKIPAHV